MVTINVFNAALNSGCDRVIFSESSAVYENVELPDTGYKEGSSKYRECVLNKGKL